GRPPPIPCPACSRPTWCSCAGTWRAGSAGPSGRPVSLFLEAAGRRRPRLLGRRDRVELLGRGLGASVIGAPVPVAVPLAVARAGRRHDDRAPPAAAGLGARVAPAADQG